MLTLLYLLMLLLFGWLTWQSTTIYGKKRSSYALLLVLVLAGLTYDMLVILLGRFIGEGNLLRLLNSGRFMIHGLFTPFIILFGFGVLRPAGISWAQSRTNHTIICILTTLLIMLGAYTEIIALDLQPETVFDTLRYINVGGLKGPPIPALLTIVFMIAAGFALWRKTNWKWLLVGSLLMFFFAGGGIGDRFYIGNIGELIFSAANVWTAGKFLSR